MFFDTAHDVLLGLLMFFIALIVFDWGRIWWFARRHGYIKMQGARLGGTSDPPWRWEASYLGYKIWTWFVRVLTWVIAAWHVSIGLCWLVDLCFALSVS